MGKAMSDSTLDATLAKIATATIQTVCSAQPTTRTEAVTTYALADVAMVGGDYVTANGDISGRKVTVGAKAAVAIDTTGTANHVALCDATELLHVTTCTSQALTAGGTVDIPAHKHEASDPT